jgi:flagellar biosynthetic protein FliR
MSNTPNRVKIGIGFFVTLLLYQALTPADAIVYDTVMEYALIVIKEALTGLLIGFGANICLSVVNFAGHVADMETGLSMVTLMDPTTKESVSITGALYQYAFMMMLIASGMYRYLLKALADSFELIPVSGAVFNSESLLKSMMQFLSDYIVIGFRIILPIFVAILLLNAVLGIMAKVSPQMNMFAIGMQLKIIVGLSVIFFTVGMLPDASDFLFSEMKKMMTSFMGGLS